MKKATYIVAGVFFALATLAGCAEAEDPSPLLESGNLKAAVQGKWAIKKIDNQLCREYSCNTNYYVGTAQDYFEFRADSAFLVYKENSVQQKICFKADYSRKGVIKLNTASWVGDFVVEDKGPSNMVLKNEFKGRDPAAVFTDTYYLAK
ncbi:hypothetical protein ACFSRY_03420 [Pontibacter locisalis]|uniref:Lipocalin-like domain-containing protein n=1 Tax=Pontibacter locisalis TaxID=1719035 RepID=A0ABW5IIH3_9BACT